MSKKSDIVEIASIIDAMKKGPFSLKKVSGKLNSSWTEERISDALDALEEKGVLSFMGSAGTHFSVDRDRLEEFLQKEQSAPAETSKKCMKVPAGPKRKFPAINEIIASLDAVKAPTVYAGEKREEKIEELFELMLGKISDVNAAIESIAAKFPMFVSQDEDLITCVRVVPEAGSTAPGGVRVTYTPPPHRRTTVLFEAPWPKFLTDDTGLRIVTKVENEAVKMLQRMSDYIVRHSVK